MKSIFSSTGKLFLRNVNSSLASLFDQPIANRQILYRLSNSQKSSTLNGSVGLFKRENALLRSNFYKCQFHTTARNQAIPPLIWFFAKPITKLGAIIAGRGFRKWWAALPKVKRDIFWTHLKNHKYKYGIAFGLTGLVSITFYQTHLQFTPITHRQRFILFNSEQLVEIEKLEKEELFQTYEKNIVSINSPFAHRALRVANRLFTANKEIKEIANIDWKLNIIDAEIVNAVAFPNGELVVFTGLLKFVENDDELATILAHEMSHAILQHAAEELSHSQLLDIISISLALIVWAVLPSDITAVLTQVFADKVLKFMVELPYSRELEKEADTVGMLLAAKACFDVRYSPVFWKRMSQLDELTIPEVLSTHPANETRALDLENLIPSALKIREECNCYKLPAVINDKIYVKKIVPKPEEAVEKSK